MALTFKTYTLAEKTYLAICEGGAIQTLVQPEDPLGDVSPYLEAFQKAAMPTSVAPAFAAKTACMIGAGAFVGPLFLLANNPSLHLVAVEINPAYINAAEKLNIQPLETPRLETVIADGARFLEACAFKMTRPGEAEITKTASELAPFLATTQYFGPFDLIYIDAFLGRNKDDVLSSPYGIALSKAALAKKGRLIFNCVVPPTDPTLLLELKAALSAAFLYVEVLSATWSELTEEENYVVLASDGKLGFEDALEL